MAVEAPPRGEARPAGRPRPKRQREEEVLVWPDLLFPEFVSAVLFTLTFVILSVFIDAPLLNRMPSFVGASALRTAEAPDAFVLTLPGPPRRRYMAGAEVQGMYVLGPLPGAALTVCLVTCGDTACIGVNVDASAVADLAGLAECLAEEVAAFAG